MIRYNLTICSYCIIVYAFDWPKSYLLASSCTLHSRKFPTSHRYISISPCLWHYIDLFHLISRLSFLKIWFLLLGFRSLIPLLNHHQQDSTLLLLGLFQPTLDILGDSSCFYVSTNEYSGFWVSLRIFTHIYT